MKKLQIFKRLSVLFIVSAFLFISVMSSFAADGDLIVNGNVGVGTTTPAAKLDVNGDIRLGNSNVSCSTTNEGSMRYNGTYKKMEICNGTSWTSMPVKTSIDKQVIASSDDIVVYNNSSSWANQALTIGNETTGYIAGTALKSGVGLRFLNVTIPAGAVITTAYLIFTANINLSNGTVKTKITGDKELNAATFSTLADYQARRGIQVGGANDTKRTAAQVTWDSIPAWIVDQQYQSPELKTIIQEIIDQTGWTSGNSLALFWDDHEGRSTAVDGTYRRGYSYDASATKCAKLHVEYIAP